MEIWGKTRKDIGYTCTREIVTSGHECRLRAHGEVSNTTKCNCSVLVEVTIEAGFVDRGIMCIHTLSRI